MLRDAIPRSELDASSESDLNAVLLQGNLDRIAQSPAVLSRVKDWNERLDPAHWGEIESGQLSWADRSSAGVCRPPVVHFASVLAFPKV